MLRNKILLTKLCLSCILIKNGINNNYRFYFINTGFVYIILIYITLYSKNNFIKISSTKFIYKYKMMK